jgi:hypothetical protein
MGKERGSAEKPSALNRALEITGVSLIASFAENLQLSLEIILSNRRTNRKSV